CSRVQRSTPLIMKLKFTISGILGRAWIVRLRDGSQGVHFTGAGKAGVTGTAGALLRQAAVDLWEGDVVHRARHIRWTAQRRRTGPEPGRDCTCRNTRMGAED